MTPLPSGVGSGRAPVDLREGLPMAIVLSVELGLVVAIATWYKRHDERELAGGGIGKG